MTVTILNADECLMSILQALNKKLPVPYEIIQDFNEEFLIKFKNKSYSNFDELWKDYELELKSYKETIEQ